MTAFDPDEHFVVVRSKRTGEHKHVDLRVLDMMLESIVSTDQAPPVPVPQITPETDQQVDALRDVLAVMQHVIETQGKTIQSLAAELELMKAAVVQVGVREVA